MTSGATGQLYGGPSFPFSNSTTTAEIDSPGAAQLGHQTALLNTINWWRLVPDTNGAGHLIASGGGTCPSTGSIVNVTCVTAAKSADGTLALAYDPTGTSLTVDMSQMLAGGTTIARWYDPTNGTFTEIAGSPFANSGSVSLAAPGANAEGADDWVLVLEASGQAAVSPSPQSQDFGSQRVGTQSAAQTFTITNTGSAPLNISTAALAGTDAGQYAESNDGCSGQAIAPNHTCTVDVAFAPTSTGAHDNASLNITSDAPSSPDKLALTGTGVASAASASPASKDFGKQRVGTVSSAQTFTITNTGSAPLNISRVALTGADAGQYVLSNANCSGRSVPPANTCSVDVAFQPVSPGKHDNAYLQITSDAPSSPDHLPLSGLAVGRPVKWLLSHFRVMQMKVRPKGLVTFDVTVPVAGVVTIMETAGTHYNPARMATAAEQLLSHAPASGLVLARHRLVVRKRGTFHMKLGATRRMKSLMAHHRQPVRVRLSVTFVPRDGPQLRVGVYNLTLTR